MPADPKPHLNESQLLWSVVDEAELPLAEQQHLASCAVCHSEQERLQRELSALGEMAKRFAPSPRTTMRLSLLEMRSRHNALRGWQNLLKWATIAATVVVMAVGPWFLHRMQNNSVAAVKREMRQDERLLMAVNRLEKNALPAFYLEITGEDEADEAAPNSNGRAVPKSEKHSSFGSARRPIAYVEAIDRRDPRC